ncbi:MAG: rpsG [Candidatus Berkelbacteria bacterium]|nr:rpsG [Candidatus Berkelbacteria bacterium]
MRAKQAKKRIIEQDIKYHSLTVSKFINKIMLRGQKETARKIVYRAFDILKNKTGKEPLEIFEGALKNTMPLDDKRGSKR